MTEQGSSLRKGRRAKNFLDASRIFLEIRMAIEEPP